MKKLSIILVLACLFSSLNAQAELLPHFTEYQKILTAIAKKPQGWDEKKRLQALLDANWQYTMKDDPEWATYAGYPGLNHLWTDLSPESNAKRVELNALTFSVAQGINPNGFASEDALNLSLFIYSMGLAVEGDKFPEELLQITQLDGIHQDAADLIDNMPADSLKDYADILSRYAKFALHMDQTIALLEQGLAKGVTPPKVTLRDVPEQIRNQITEDPFASPMLTPFVEMPKEFSDAQKKALRDNAAKMYAEKIRPAFEKLLGFVEKKYLPGARESIAAESLPDGKNWYAYNVKSYTTTPLTPKQLHDIGLKEVIRIRAEMEKIKTATGFKGTLEEFFNFLRTDKKFFFTDKRALIMAYRDIAKRADAELVKLFGILPRLPYGVEPVPAYAEKSQTTAYYQPGTLEAGRPGVFYANTYDLPSRPRWEMEALTLHEAVPGHHFQISIGKEVEGLPEFRKEADYTAFIEGWGLYSESLGDDMGFYKSPYAKFGQLTYEMWRSIRLVVDTGMHSLGWTREQAIKFFEANAGKAGHDIIVEVDRYIVWPGQALAYKTGQLKFKELRERAKAKLGDKFDIRKFHDEVLRHGPLPLNVLDMMVEKWIADTLKG